MRAAMPPGIAGDRLDQTIQLNADTLATIRRTAQIIEAHRIRSVIL